MPERKVPLGVAEADALAAWLDIVARDYRQVVPTHRVSLAEQMRGKYIDRMAAEAEAWAKTVRPVEIGGVVMKEEK